MLRASLAALTSIILSANVRAEADKSTNYFYTPTALPGGSHDWWNNQLWAQGSVQQIKWHSTDAAPYTIELWQQDTTQDSASSIVTVYSSTGNEAGDRSFSWTVSTYSTNVSFSPVFFFWLNANQDLTGFTSKYFNISSEVVSSTATESTRTWTDAATSSTLPASETSTPVSTSTTALIPSLASASPTAIPRKDSSPSTSTIGLAVGFSVGITILLIAGALLVLRSVRRRKLRATSKGPLPTTGQFPSGVLAERSRNPAHYGFHEKQEDTIHEKEGWNNPVELHSRDQIPELGSWR